MRSSEFDGGSMRAADKSTDTSVGVTRTFCSQQITPRLLRRQNQDVLFRRRRRRPQGDEASAKGRQDRGGDAGSKGQDEA